MCSLRVIQASPLFIQSQQSGFDKQAVGKKSTRYAECVLLQKNKTVRPAVNKQKWSQTYSEVFPVPAAGGTVILEAMFFNIERMPTTDFCTSTGS